VRKNGLALSPGAAMRVEALDGAIGASRTDLPNGDTNLGLGI
jgi:hypothetical protein